MIEAFIRAHVLPPLRREHRNLIRAQHIIQDIPPFPPQQFRLRFPQEFGLVAVGRIQEVSSQPGNHPAKETVLIHEQVNPRVAKAFDNIERDRCRHECTNDLPHMLGLNIQLLHSIFRSAEPYLRDVRRPESKGTRFARTVAPRAL
jgi:hypothetical protein